MKIIKRLLDNVVIFAGDDLAIDQDGCRGTGWQFRNIDPNDLTLEEVDNIPAPFVGGGWSYADGVWTSNSVWQEYMDEMNKSLVPISATKRQLRLTLLNMNILSAADTFVAEQSQEVQIYWNDSQDFYRQHQMIISLSAQFGLTEAQVDDIFIVASQK